MAHVRTQIRDAAVASLSGLPTTGTRVYSGRSRQLAKDHEPSLLIYCTEETSSIDAAGSDPIMERIVRLLVEGHVVATEAADMEETLDQIALEVEPVILMSSFGGRARAVFLVATRIAVESPGERHSGVIRMEFEVNYRTRESAPDKVV